MLRGVLATVKAVVLAVLLLGPAAGMVHNAGPAERTTDGCTRTGAADGAGSALIRTHQGRVRQVSFDVAWDVYEGRRPGTVVAVCVDRPHRR